MENEFEEIILREFNYDIDLAESINESNDNLYLEESGQTTIPIIQFPGLGFIKVVWVEEQDNGEW